jgi:hypothetical protein
MVERPEALPIFMANETKKFKIEFNGRPRGAIGVNWDHQVEVEASDKDAAVLKLYESYDHVTVKKVAELVTLEPDPHTLMLALSRVRPAKPDEH